MAKQYLAHMLFPSLAIALNLYLEHEVSKSSIHIVVGTFVWDQSVGGYIDW